MIKQRKNYGILVEIWMPVVFFCVVMFFVLGGISLVSRSSSSEQLTIMEDAIRRNAVQCYAIEGEYPEDLYYLSDNYNVVLNQEKYVYHYEYMGGNILPEIAVFSR